MLRLWFLWDTQRVSIRQLNLWDWKSKETLWLEIET